MSKDDQLIMVVKRTALFRPGYFSGFLPAGTIDYESEIFRNFTYVRRGEAEKDPAGKQPIGYAIIVNPSHRHVFAYRRATTAAQYDEARLRGTWSWGVGGHIERCDRADGNPILASLRRELAEEIAVEGELAISVLGYINDDTTDVGSVHFGVLYVAQTNANEVRPKSPEIAEGSLRTIEALEQILDDPACTVEEWSKIAFPPLKAHLKTQCPPGP